MGTTDIGDRLKGLDEADETHEAGDQSEIWPKTPGTGLLRYADKAMYPAEPMPDLTPTVKLLWMTPDPLGAMAAMSGIYEGRVFRSLLEVSNEDRRRHWEAMQETHLKAPLEAVKLHFLIENVDRAFTHQLVRQRTAVFAQESLRFAVKEDLAMETPKPPSFGDPRVADSPSKRNDLDDLWDTAMEEVQRAYLALIASGVPAEDARGLLPTACLTRIHYITDLRNLLEHAGNRLCTQAQFHWRSVFMQIRECIRNYWFQMHNEDYARGLELEAVGHAYGVEPFRYPDDLAAEVYRAWQFELIADEGFKPQCYLQGKCPFKAEFDRGCTIRHRVDDFAAHGVPSSQWSEGAGVHDIGSPISRDIPAIDDAEWLEDPQAAWVK